ncbi:hypothetical protein HNR09_002533 [Nesterenkonia xinjiangensis]|uniref:Transposase n=1 Tax=Nesterenkonia xinjiangensis TaxID=225327 RepID=A0A7Z0GNE6_9MICC|nr:hypothetical protein [Nesterenkonia xinjiangensis]
MLRVRVRDYGCPECRRPGKHGQAVFIEAIDPLSRAVPQRQPEVINGRWEHLRGTALAFRHLANRILRALLDTGGFSPLLPPHLR